MGNNSIRKKLSQRHDAQKRYEFVSMSGGKVTIRDRESGKEAVIKGAWVETDGIDCWAGSTRKAIHIENAVWEKKE